MIALIPARAGSKRVPGKNMRPLAGHPLIAYTIAAAIESRIFTHIDVCTDCAGVAEAASPYGASLVRRVSAPDDQPDIVWVSDVLARYHVRPGAFAILRPTSPFRTAATIRRCMEEFRKVDGTHDSIRAVEPVTQTPYKMWTWSGPGFPIIPLLSQPEPVPYHSSPTQSCPPVWIQNSSLEMGWTRNVDTLHSIAGRKIIPFFTHGYEGFSIDTEADWRVAEWAIASGEATLPPVSVAPLQADSWPPPWTHSGGTVAR